MEKGGNYANNFEKQKFKQGEKKKGTLKNYYGKPSYFEKTSGETKQLQCH